MVKSPRTLTGGKLLGRSYLLMNKLTAFYSKEEKFNKTEVISKFKKKFKVIGVNGFKEMDHYGKKFHLDYIYVQKGGQIAPLYFN